MKRMTCLSLALSLLLSLAACGGGPETVSATERVVESTESVTGPTASVTDPTTEPTLSPH